MNRDALRLLLNDGWVRALLVVLPLAIAAQFTYPRPVAEVALSVMFIATAAAYTLVTGYRRAETRLAIRRDAEEHERMRAELGAFLADRKK